MKCKTYLLKWHVTFMLNLVNGEEKIASLNSVRLGFELSFQLVLYIQGETSEGFLCLLNYSVIKPLQSNCEASHILLNVSWLNDIWRTACLLICCFKGSKFFRYCVYLLILRLSEIRQPMPSAYTFFASNCLFALKSQFCNIKINNNLKEKMPVKVYSITNRIPNIRLQKP